VEKSYAAGERGTESGTLVAQSGDQSAQIDGDVKLIIAAWPTLPADAKAAIMGTVKAAAG
jgi:hypothetical protein